MDVEETAIVEVDLENEISSCVIQKCETESTNGIKQLAGGNKDENTPKMETGKVISDSTETESKTGVRTEEEKNQSSSPIADSKSVQLAGGNKDESTSKMETGNVISDSTETESTTEVHTEEEKNQSYCLIADSKSLTKDLSDIQLFSDEEYEEDNNDLWASPSLSEDIELQKDIQSFLGEEVGRIIMDAEADGKELKQCIKRKAEIIVECDCCKKPRIEPSNEDTMDDIVREKLVDVLLPFTRRYAEENPTFHKRFADGYSFEVQDIEPCPQDDNSTVVFPFHIGFCVDTDVLICGERISRKANKQAKPLSDERKREMPQEVLKLIKVFEKFIQSKPGIQKMGFPEKTKQIWSGLCVYINKKREMMISFNVFVNRLKCKVVHDMLIDLFTNGEGKTFKIISIYVTCLFKVNRIEGYSTELILGEHGFEILDGLKLYHVPNVDIWCNLHGLKMLCQGVEELLAPDQTTAILDIFCSTGELGLYLSKLAGEVLSYDDENIIKSTRRSANYSNCKAIEYFSGDPYEEFQDRLSTSEFEKMVAVINWHPFVSRTLSVEKVMKIIRKMKKVRRCVAVMNSKIMTQFPLRVLCSTEKLKEPEPFIPVMVKPIDAMPHLNSRCMVLILLERIGDVSGKYIPFRGSGRQTLTLIKDSWWNWLREEDETPKQRRIRKVDEFEREVKERKMQRVEMEKRMELIEKKPEGRLMNKIKDVTEGKMMNKNVHREQGSAGAMIDLGKEELSKGNQQIGNNTKKRTRTRPRRRRKPKMESSAQESNMGNAQTLKNKKQTGMWNKKESLTEKGYMKGQNNLGGKRKINQNMQQQRMLIAEEEKQQQWQLQQQGIQIVKKLTEAQLMNRILEEKRLIMEEEQKLMLEMEQRRLIEIEERNRFMEGEKRRLMEEERRQLVAQEQRQLMEEERKRVQEEERRRLQEEKRRRLQEEERRRLKEEERRRLKEGERRRLKEEERRRLLEEERRRLKEEERRQLLEEEQRRLIEEEVQRRLKEEERRLKIRMEEDYRKRLLDDTFRKGKTGNVIDYNRSCSTPNMVRHPDVNWMNEQQNISGRGVSSKNSPGPPSLLSLNVDMPLSMSEQKSKSFLEYSSGMQQSQLSNLSLPMRSSLHSRGQFDIRDNDQRLSELNLRKLLGYDGMSSVNNALMNQGISSLGKLYDASENSHTKHDLLAEVGGRNVDAFGRHNDRERSAVATKRDRYRDREKGEPENLKWDMRGNHREGEKGGYGSHDDRERVMHGNHSANEMDAFGRPDNRGKNSYGKLRDRERNPFGSYSDRERGPFGSRIDGERGPFGSRIGGEKGPFGSRIDRERGPLGSLIDRERGSFGSHIDREMGPFGSHIDREGSSWKPRRQRE